MLLMINGLEIETTYAKVRIHDPLHDVSELEANKIMQYLLDEAIVDNPDMECEIVRK